MVFKVSDRATIAALEFLLPFAERELATETDLLSANVETPEQEKAWLRHNPEWRRVYQGIRQAQDVLDRLKGVA